MSDVIWSNLSKIGEQLAGLIVQSRANAQAVRTLSDRISLIEAAQQKSEQRWAAIKWWCTALIGIIGTALQFRAFLVGESGQQLLDILAAVLTASAK